jgi:DNA-binding XRE family transcriptional regulator
MIGTLNIEGVDYVVIPRAEYEGRWPKLPPPDARGERPAKSAVLAVIARSMIRRRTVAGLDQKRLAQLAGIRAETISRIESGRYRPRRETMLRIDQALTSVAASAKKKSRQAGNN